MLKPTAYTESVWNLLPLGYTLLTSVLYLKCININDFISMEIEGIE